jgi:membrane-bound inhibitor of C-type lysozyme
MTTKSLFVRGLIAMAALVVVAAPACAADNTTGKVTIDTWSAGAGLGVTWGDGVLEYRGEKYPFTVTGFNIGEVGVAKVSAKGMVFNLKSVEDFSGMFASAIASGTLGGGAGSGAMYNQNSVSMVWTGTNQGLNFTLAHSGVNVQLTPEAKQQAAQVRQNAAAERQQPAAAPRPSQ